MKHKTIGLGILLSVTCVFFGLARQKEFPALQGPYLGQKPPGQTPELFAPGIISTCSQHSSVYFSRDGKEVYFSRMFPRPSVIMYMCERNGRWTAPKVICEGLTPGLAPDGRTVYFSTWKLWRMFKTPEGWTEPELLPDHINFQKRQDTPYAADDRTLYFCSMFGNDDGIYRARWNEEEYARPERIEYGISGGGANFSPYIAPDESYLIFASTRPGYGISDLYISFRDEDGGWTRPKNMGPRVNTSAKEVFPFVSFDGKYLFFMSNRVSELNNTPIPDGPGNVYWMDAGFIQGLRQKEGEEKK